MGTELIAAYTAISRIEGLAVAYGAGIGWLIVMSIWGWLSTKLDKSGNISVDFKILLLYNRSVNR